MVRWKSSRKSKFKNSEEEGKKSSKRVHFRKTIFSVTKKGG